MGVRSKRFGTIQLPWDNSHRPKFFILVKSVVGLRMEGGVKFPTPGNLNKIFILTRAVTRQNTYRTVKMLKCTPITLHFVMNKYFQIVTMSYDLTSSH